MEIKKNIILFLVYLFLAIPLFFISIGISWISAWFYNFGVWIAYLAIDVLSFVSSIIVAIVGNFISDTIANYWINFCYLF